MIKPLLLAAMIAAPMAQADICQDVEKLAGGVIAGFQSNVPMSKMYATAKDNKIAQIIVEDAYGQPSYMGDEMKRRQKVQFQSKWFGACLKSSLNKGK